MWGPHWAADPDVLTQVTGLSIYSPVRPAGLVMCQTALYTGSPAESDVKNMLSSKPKSDFRTKLLDIFSDSQ